MTNSFSGDDDLRRLAAALRESGNRDLKNRTAKALREGVKPWAAKVSREGAEQLPSRGGLRSRVAGYPVTVGSTWGKSPSVTLSLRRVRGYNNGRLRHPVFGNRDVWARQSVDTAGAYTEAFESHVHEVTPRVRAAIQGALDEIARKV